MKEQLTEVVIFGNVLSPCICTGNDILTDVSNKANARASCLCADIAVKIEMRRLNLEELGEYPVRVFNVNLEEIGIAYDKAQYISIWNANGANTATGTLSGAYGPFTFKFLQNAGPKPLFVYGEPVIHGDFNDDFDDDFFNL